MDCGLSPFDRFRYARTNSCLNYGQSVLCLYPVSPLQPPPRSRSPMTVQFYVDLVCVRNVIWMGPLLTHLRSHVENHLFVSSGALDNDNEERKLWGRKITAKMSLLSVCQYIFGWMLMVLLLLHCYSCYYVVVHSIKHRQSSKGRV